MQGTENSFELLHCVLLLYIIQHNASLFIFIPNLLCSVVPGGRDALVDVCRFAASSLSQSFLYPRTQLPDSTRMDSILWTSQPGVQNASSLSIFIFSFPFFGTQKCFLVNLSWSSTRIYTDISSQQVHSYGN